MRLPGKVTFLTGAGSGLGRSAALLFAEEGAKVIVSDIDGERAERVTAEIEAHGGEALALRLDVTREADVTEAMRQAIERFAQLDVLFCNAGVPSSRESFEEQDPADWRRVLDINVVGTLLCIQAAVPHLRANGGGAVLNTSSGAALMAMPRVAAYCASKGAIVALTRALALDLGPDNIRVNAICPMGGMSANFVLPAGAPLIDEASLYTDYLPADSPGPLARPTPPRLIDHARAALFLVSDDAGWITGVALPVDGGITIRPQVDIERTIRAYQSARPSQP